MPCLCGDPECPSCGPAQGLGPEADTWMVCDWMEHAIFADIDATLKMQRATQAISIGRIVALLAIARFAAHPAVYAEMREAAAAWHKER